jgi:hypothetical protein
MPSQSFQNSQTLGQFFYPLYENSAKKLNEKGILKVMPSWLESIVIVHGLKGEKGVCKRNVERGAMRAGRSSIHS